MIVRKSMTILGLAAFAAMGLSAADSPFDAGVALTVGKGLSLKHDVTGKDFGGIVEFGYTGQIANSGVPFRAGLGLGFFPGADTHKALGTSVYNPATKKVETQLVDHNTASKLSAIQLTGDIMHETGVDGLRVVFGLSLNKWNYTRTADLSVATRVDATTTLPVGTRMFDQSDAAKGIKFGARIGVEYRINKQFSANVMLQATELATDFTASRSYNPSWVQFGARYHF